MKVTQPLFQHVHALRDGISHAYLKRCVPTDKCTWLFIPFVNPLALLSPVAAPWLGFTQPSPNWQSAHKLNRVRPTRGSSSEWQGEPNLMKLAEEDTLTLARATPLCA